ncbi:DUF192 domain-containing protein [Candidatus Woesearchaeota archaeon]|nr:DUF192 domain-containing protein [Candidatus Woesearchaeota archaeon]
MKKSLVILFIILFLISGCSQNQKKVCFEKNCFQVELAVTDEEKTAGLMYRPYLEKNNGMLFIYDDENIRSFWMKNTLIPLDLIWINKNNQVVFIKENAQPCNESCDIITLDKKAKYVLEINSGKIKELGIRLNEEIKILI